MRILAIVLALMIALLQWPLWIGKGSWLRVWQLDQELSDRHAQNDRLKERNAALEAEVLDLKTGTDAIEERARNELGMIRPDEVFFQVLDARRQASAASSVALASAPQQASAPR
ncbi:Cell division protein FtsB [Andreprevotia sp. IGB-42]|uniref:cell division protein FtsB n=1 Tax=Andreprevotia sp. IGB-42 TaxID=2497473 RepID=UPI001357FEA6|nr:cell division protein FtsB [Andreprevotia sp. IGB-42]KAF0813284.1 Cell division protein FtsB [Andreprevotia sp. IGB-42]